MVSWRRLLLAAFLALVVPLRAMNALTASGPAASHPALPSATPGWQGRQLAVADVIEHAHGSSAEADHGARAAGPHCHDGATDGQTSKTGHNCSACAACCAAAAIPVAAVEVALCKAASIRLDMAVVEIALVVFAGLDRPPQFSSPA
jgi:hypothetical protein